MKRTLTVVAVLLAVAGCASPSITAVSLPTPPSASPAQVPTAPPTPAPSPIVSCGGLAPADCSAAATATLSALAGRSGTVTRVELDRGVFCPTPGLLLAGTTCPGGSMPAPDGGEWIGAALVSYSGVPAQAYLDVERNAGTISAVFIALATPPPASAVPNPEPCQAGDLRARTDRQGETGVVHGDILLTNVGPTACILDGPPVAVQLIAADGQALSTEPEAPVPTTLEPVRLDTGVADAGWLIVYWVNWCGPPPGPLHIRITLAGPAGILDAKFDGSLVARCDAPGAPSTLQTEGFLPNP